MRRYCECLEVFMVRSSLTAKEAWLCEMGIILARACGALSYSVLLFVVSSRLIVHILMFQ